MRINNNMLAMNTHRQMGITGVNQGKSMEKLSSGQRINRAGDDAAGLAISEKMRGQIRGLNMASKNSQDGISMIQTAEGALNETHAILQRMRELAVQSGNDTNVTADRSEIQKEMNQLTTEINRIGNTTEFNTQSVLKGDGKASLEETKVVTNGKLLSGTTTHVQASQEIEMKALSGVTDNGKTITFNLNGQDINIKFENSTSVSGTKAVADTDNADANNITIKMNGTVAAADAKAAVEAALKAVIAKNSELAQNFTVIGSGTAADNTTISAVAGGTAEGVKGAIAGVDLSSLATPGVDGAASVGSTTHVAAKKEIDLSSIATDADLKDLVGKGMTINGQQVEFYNANDGAYTGEGIGVNINTALEDTTNKGIALAKAIADTVGSKIDGVSVTNVADKVVITDTVNKGKDGNDKIEVKDGGVQEAFKSNFQVGANQGQSMTIEIKDMRSKALGLTGKAGDAGFTAGNSVTNGTNNTGVEAALDVSTHEKAAAAITVVNAAIEKVSAQRSDLGSFQNRLEHTIKNLDTSAENLQAAESRVRDVDMAKEMMNLTKQNILQQASQAMMAQANSAPQGVLQLLR